MSIDSSREQRRLAGEFIATARLITDSDIRASILALAQKWLDLAEREPGEGEGFNRVAYLCDIQTKIGQELRARYDLSQELPQRMLALLMQLNDDEDSDHGGAPETQAS